MQRSHDLSSTVRSVVLATVAALVLSGSARPAQAQTCSSTYPTCGGICPAGSVCVQDSIEGRCECEEAFASACSCDASGPAGDLPRAIDSARRGEQNVHFANDLYEQSDPKTLSKLAKGFHKLGLTFYKLNSLNAAAGSPDANLDKLTKKIDKFGSKVVKLDDKLQAQVDKAGSDPQVLSARATSSINAWLGLIRYDVGGLVSGFGLSDGSKSCSGDSNVGCGGSCPSQGGSTYSCSTLNCIVLPPPPCPCTCVKN